MTNSTSRLGVRVLIPSFIHFVHHFSCFRRNSCSGSNPIGSRRGQVPRSSRRPKVREAWQMASIGCETNLGPNHKNLLNNGQQLPCPNFDLVLLIAQDTRSVCGKCSFLQVLAQKHCHHQLMVR
jgi:hypothetical protein